MRKPFLIMAAAAFALVFSPELFPAAFAKECLECHDFAAVSQSGAVVHQPFAEKDCGACHLDHGDQGRLVLKAQGNKVCEDCHDFAKPPFLAAHRKIAPTGKGLCAGCHDPHRSPNRRLLRAALHASLKEGKCEACHRSDGKLKIPMQLGFCHLCHDKKEFARLVIHDPVKKGRCFDCHDPHGSRWRSLLRANYTPEREVLNGETDYALCLRCHKAEAFRAGASAGTTRFAVENGRNLHALHVQPGLAEADKTAARKGLTCRNCHELHSGTKEALTRTELECGSSFCLKLQFHRVEGGGECFTSCHGERVRYQNGIPGFALPAAKTSEPQPANPPPSPAP